MRLWRSCISIIISMRYICKDLKSSVQCCFSFTRIKTSWWYCHLWACGTAIMQHCLFINQDFIAKFAHPCTDDFLLPNTSKYYIHFCCWTPGFLHAFVACLSDMQIFFPLVNWPEAFDWFLLTLCLRFLLRLQKISLPWMSFRFMESYKGC